jgi:hypothetical protein
MAQAFGVVHVLVSGEATENGLNEGAGLWADGSASQHIENLVVTGNRFLNEANNAGYRYGIVLTFYNDNLVLGADNVFYNIKGHNVWQR